MPYLPEPRRSELDDLYTPHADTPGDMNFLMTKVALRYLEMNGTSYQTINDVMGAFACAAQEFYRRVAADYETSKMIQNGDVYR